MLSSTASVIGLLNKYIMVYDNILNFAAWNNFFNVVYRMTH